MNEIQRGNQKIIIKSTIALITGSLVFLALYLGSMILDLQMNFELMALSTIIVASLIASFSDKIAIKIAKYIISARSSDESVHANDRIALETAMKPENWFLLRSFLTLLLKPVIRDINKVHIMITDKNDAILELGATSIGWLDPIYSGDLFDSVSYIDEWGIIAYDEASKDIYIFIDNNIASRFLQSVEKGNGDSVVITSSTELLAIYRIVKEAYLARYPGISHELAAYTAYKTILNLKNSGLIRVSDALFNTLPDEPPELKQRIKEQVLQEIG